MNRGPRSIRDSVPNGVRYPVTRIPSRYLTKTHNVEVFFFTQFYILCRGSPFGWTLAQCHDPLIFPTKADCQVFCNYKLVDISDYQFKTEVRDSEVTPCLSVKGPRNLSLRLGHIHSRPEIFSVRKYTNSLFKSRVGQEIPSVIPPFLSLRFEAGNSC